jgi:predicted transcriptional regulator
VSVVTPRDEYLKKESRSYVEEAFGGSLPAFITAFTAEESLTKEEALELRRLIDRAKESCRA